MSNLLLSILILLEALVLFVIVGFGVFAYFYAEKIIKKYVDKAVSKKGNCKC